MNIHDFNPIKLVHKGVEAVSDGTTSAVNGIKHEVDNLIPDRFDAIPKLPPYTQLPAAERVKAEQRSVGLTYPQRAITTATGEPHEPVNLVITGTREEVIAALEKGGWHKADEINGLNGLKTAYTMLDKITGLHKVFNYDYESSPVSDMYLDGKRYDMAFNKNNIHNMGRDHLRVFDTGKKDAQGRPIWEVAATRDTGIHIDLKHRNGNHEIDHNVDPERDQVMADLLGSGEVKDWQVAKGIRTSQDDASISKDYQTDGKIYTIDLTPHTDLTATHHESTIGKVVDHMPEFVQDGIHGVDKKLTKLFKSWM